jgi:hypothetical protein
MKNLLMKCIEIFLIYLFLILNILNDVIVVNIIFESPFHINFFTFFMDFFINHMFKDIHRLVY